MAVHISVVGCLWQLAKNEGISIDFFFFFFSHQQWKTNGFPALYHRNFGPTARWFNKSVLSCLSVIVLWSLNKTSPIPVTFPSCNFVYLNCSKTYFIHFEEVLYLHYVVQWNFVWLWLGFVKYLVAFWNFSVSVVQFALILETNSWISHHLLVLRLVLSLEAVFPLVFVFNTTFHKSYFYFTDLWSSWTFPPVSDLTKLKVYLARMCQPKAPSYILQLLLIVAGKSELRK